MLAPSPSSASSSLSILRSAKLSRTPPVGLIRAVCLCEAAGALGAAGARHCQWTERLTLPGSRTQTHDPRFPCYCFHLNPTPPSFSCSCLFPFLRVCLLLLLSPLSLSASVSLSLSTSWFLSVAPLFPSFLPPTLKPGRERRTAAASGRNITQRNRERLWEHSRKKKKTTNLRYSAPSKFKPKLSTRGESFSIYIFVSCRWRQFNVWPLKLGLFELNLCTCVTKSSRP